MTPQIPILESYSILLKDTSYNFEIYQEEDISWQQHNEIHQALNLAFSFRTQAFTHKTYAYCVPNIRILCKYNNILIGHTAIFEDYVIVNEQKILIAGHGLLLSLEPKCGIANLLRLKAIQICSLAAYPCAIGRVKNDEPTKKTLAPLVHTFLDIPLIGNTTRSHDWETLAIYNTGGDKDYVESLVTHFKKTGYIQIEGEIF